jgi:hypothetical protein
MYVPYNGTLASLSEIKKKKQVEKMDYKRQTQHLPLEL